MPVNRPKDTIAGFHASGLAAAPELEHAGERWAPAHWRIETHAHGVWELLLQLSGEALWESGGAEYALQPGDLFVVAPGVTHFLRQRSGSRHHFLYAAIDLEAVWRRLPELRPHWRGPLFCLRGADALTAPFRALIREASVERPYSAAAIRCTLDLLLIETTRLMEKPAGAPATAIMHRAVAIAKEYLDAAPERDWKLAELARLTGLSATHFAEIFSRDTGEPPRRYLLRKRIERARELLAGTDIPISELALELGFSSSQHFAAAFRRHTGSTPRAYRCSKFLQG